MSHIGQDFLYFGLTNMINMTFMTVPQFKNGATNFYSQFDIKALFKQARKDKPLLEVKRDG
jgi:hypothetical protein